MNLRLSTLAALVLALLPLQSWAVKTAHCPEALTAVAEGFDLRKTAEEIMGETVYEDDIETLQATQESLKYIGETLEEMEVDLALSEAKNGRCLYRGPGHMRIMISSSKGHDSLMMQMPIGPRGQLLRVYVNNITLDEQGLTLPEGRTAMYLAIPRTPYTDYTAGGPLVKIGFVDRVGLK